MPSSAVHSGAREGRSYWVVGAELDAGTLGPRSPHALAAPSGRYLSLHLQAPVRLRLLPPRRCGHWNVLRAAHDRPDNGLIEIVRANGTEGHHSIHGRLSLFLRRLTLRVSRRASHWRVLR